MIDDIFEQYDKINYANLTNTKKNSQISKISIQVCILYLVECLLKMTKNII